jgi:hypothetical protein
MSYAQLLKWIAMRLHNTWHGKPPFGPWHDEGSRPQAAPITKHKKEKLPKLCLAHPVTGCSAQIPSSSLECGELTRGVGVSKAATDSWLLRDDMRVFA